MAFLSLNISMGIVNSSDLKDFWSTNAMLCQPWFPSAMSRDRFLQMLYYGNQSSTGKGKPFKLRALSLIDHSEVVQKRLSAKA